MGIPSPNMFASVPICVPTCSVPSCVMFWLSLPSMNVIMLVIPMTTPLIIGVRKLICDFMSDITSAIKSLSLSFTLCISLMYLDTLSTACAAIFGPFLMLSMSTFMLDCIIALGYSVIAPTCGLNIASFTPIPSFAMFVATSLKNFPAVVSVITSATFWNAISAGIPSPSLFPSWNSALANSFSSFFADSLILITFWLLSLWYSPTLNARLNGNRRLITLAPSPYGPIICPVCPSLYPSRSNPKKLASYPGATTLIISGVIPSMNMLIPVIIVITAGLIWNSAFPILMIMFLYFFSSGFISVMSVCPYPVGLCARMFLPMK